MNVMTSLLVGLLACNEPSLSSARHPSNPAMVLAKPAAHTAASLRLVLPPTSAAPQADPPDFGRIPADDIVGVTVILLTCSYKEKVGGWGAAGRASPAYGCSAASC